MAGGWYDLLTRARSRIGRDGKTRRPRVQSAGSDASDSVAALPGSRKWSWPPLRSYPRGTLPRWTNPIAVAGCARSSEGRRPLRAWLLRNARRTALRECGNRHVSDPVPLELPARAYADHDLSCSRFAMRSVRRVEAQPRAAHRAAATVSTK